MWRFRASVNSPLQIWREKNFLIFYVGSYGDKKFQTNHSMKLARECSLENLKTLPEVASIKISYRCLNFKFQFIKLKFEILIANFNLSVEWHLGQVERQGPCVSC